MQSKSSRNSAGSRRSRGLRNFVANADPPQIPSNVSITRTWRFKSTGDAAQVISGADLAAMAGGICSVANTTLALLAFSCKVHRISIWSPPSAQGAVVTNRLEWYGPDGVDVYKEVSDSSMSVSRPAHLSARPPAGSLASFVVGPNTANAVLSITAPTGSIIDVHCTHVLYDNAAASATYTVAAGTLGVLYYLPLDGASDVFLPVALNTTT